MDIKFKTLALKNPKISNPAISPTLSIKYHDRNGKSPFEARGHGLGNGHCYGVSFESGNGGVDTQKLIPERDVLIQVDFTASIRDLWKIAFSYFVTKPEIEELG